MKNRRMAVQEFYETVLTSLFFLPIPMIKGEVSWVGFFNGKTVLIHEDIVIFFERCEHCGKNELSLKGCCKFCGAYPYQ